MTELMAVMGRLLLSAAYCVAVSVVFGPSSLSKAFVKLRHVDTLCLLSSFRI